MPTWQKKWRSCSKQERLQTLFGYTYTTQEPWSKVWNKIVSSPSLKKEDHYLIYLTLMRGPNQAPSARASLLLPPHLSYFNGHKPCTWILHRGAASNKFRVLTDSNSNPKFNNTSDSYQLPHSSYLKDLMHRKITSNGSQPQVSENPALPRCPDTESSPHLV